jgi:hypothetical protein
MNSSVVNKEIKSLIRPLLQEAGFTQFTPRTAWRYSRGQIDVINFQSFHSYLANSIGCTTYSFCVRLGCCFDAIPQSDKVKKKNGHPRPEECQCQFRLTLQKSIEQTNLKRTDVWYVDPTAKNLEAVIADAEKAILETGLTWFNRYSDPAEVLRTLLEDSESNESTHGFGAKSSPIRHFFTGLVALSLGQIRLAKEHLEGALDSGCFNEFEPKMRSELERIENTP